MNEIGNKILIGDNGNMRENVRKKMGSGAFVSWFVGEIREKLYW